MRQVVILGSTGSIGTQAIEVISERPERFEVVGLAAGGNSVELLVSQAKHLHPAVVAVSDTAAADRVAEQLPGVEVLAGPDAATILAARSCDVVLNGITGAAGLAPTLATLGAGTTLALANKESLVIGGRLVTEAAAPGQIVAVDSEHSAFAQALRAGRADEVRRLILTASGGPFRGRSKAELRDVTPDQAMAHPTWAMGRVITINSATLVNKGLELLEAGLLYNVDLDAIQVVVHPQSIVHSMVEFHDGSTIAQCSPPDMKLPIALGLTWPERLADAARPCDWTSATSWTFEPLDSEAFPAVELARRAGKAGGTVPAVYNAANEVCVDAFCAGDLDFSGIVDVVADVVAEQLANPVAAEMSVASVLAADSWARTAAAQRIKER
ncbi:1-deoxy-D-xylulose 5-phosphate reductoisomerase [Propionicimonas paludicola]|uniref:1-deoxy-D-xylulose 5-phosphate reductoisomerase n=1 Tax=Propionicimonas paludicola TaxID=185243 RepID=A0A2A9CS85_9ACTN|nr:1-deoxy-D-xylulose-5-phosphate reductoisomerase [Propionicimonas paludicola]PFG16399.1 1-deoxy-D-xylulose 5-phosphate reductoisomerase [Propionicimonas paludicola]